MIVLGADMHKQTHTVAVIAAATGELRGEKTVQVGDDGFLALLDWARSLGSERVWALEDCRHVSGSLERFLMASGERVVRVATKLMNDARRAGRDRGKSDRIDALAVARAALREGIEALPSAQLAGVELEIRLLVDHRERLIRSRVAINTTCSGTCTTSGRSSSCPAARCSQRSGRRGSLGAWRAPSRPRASGSPATSCDGCANSRLPPTRLRPRSQTLSTRSRRNCSPRSASGL